MKLSELSHFTTKQSEAYKALQTHKFTLYGGAMGGGKSYWLRWSLIALLLKWWRQEGKKNIRVGLFCEDYPALKDRHISKIKEEFIKLGRYKEMDHNFVMYPKLGSGIISFRNLDDTSKYQSSEFAAIAVDEITKNQEDTFNYLRTRLRWPGISDVKFLAASNPGGVGHGWVKRKWLDREFDDKEPEKDQFEYIQALASDNPHLDSHYIQSLQGLPETMRKAFLEGNWDIFKGQYFTEWNPRKHTVEPFPIPQSWKKFRVYDHGRDNPACMLWCAVDHDGRVWIYRELYVRGMDVDQIASQALNLSQGEVYDYSVADPSIFAKTGFTDKTGGQTIAETFARYGVLFYKASNRRVDGWNLMHQYLRWDEFHYPKLVFFNICHNSIRTIPSLVHDSRVGEDVDTGGEDHCGDCVRYFLMSLHERSSVIPKTEVELKLQQLQKSQVLTPSQLNNFYG